MKTRRIISLLLITLLIAMSITPAYAEPKQRTINLEFDGNGQVEVTIKKGNSEESVDIYTGNVVLKPYINRTVIIKAIPDNHFKEFVILETNEGGQSWSYTKNDSNVFEIKNEHDYHITVRFKKTYTITTGVIGNGSVSVEVNGEVLSGTGPYTGIPEGANVTLKAIPDEGSLFVEWSGDIEGPVNPFSFEIDKDYSVTAKFAEEENDPEPTTYTITTDVIGYGSVSVKVNEEVLSGTGPYTGIPEGANVTLEAIPDEGSRFVEWSGDIEGSVNPYSFNIDKDYNVTAKFAEEENDPEPEPEIDPRFIDGAQIRGEAENGYIEDEDGNILDSEGKFYSAGSIVRLTAFAHDGYEFAGWEFQGADEFIHIETSDNTAEIRIPEALPGNLDEDPVWLNDGILVIARFDPIPTPPPVPTPTAVVTTYYSLNIEVDGPGRVLPISGLYTENSMVVFTINPDEGARFVGWFGENGSEVVNNSIVMNGSKKLIARFEAMPAEEPEEEEEFSEEVIPEAAPETTVSDQDIPYDAPALPNTGGIPMGLMIGAGAGLLSAGLSLRKKNKKEQD